ncbi:hypothetical protein MJO29_015065 [Puccinia striiformis f. sp. tritici]|nr:hypothetical protein MJO29_015065 [Puccinia striiformis f. sp. tritici]
MLASEQLDLIAIRTLLKTHGTHLDPGSEEANLVGAYNTLRSRQIEIPGTAQPSNNTCKHPRPEPSPTDSLPQHPPKRTLLETEQIAVPAKNPRKSQGRNSRISSTPSRQRPSLKGSSAPPPPPLVISATKQMQTQSTPSLPLSVAPEKRLAPIEFPISTASPRRPCPKIVPYSSSEIPDPKPDKEPGRLLQTPKLSTSNTLLM